MAGRSGRSVFEERKNPVRFGEKGLVHVRYLGDLPREFQGCVTDTLYVWHDTELVLPVDRRDLTGLAREGGRENFEELLVEAQPDGKLEKDSTGLVPVRVLRKFGDARAITWVRDDGSLRAGLVPTTAIKDLHCKPAALAKARLYAADFVALLADVELTTPEDIERELRKRGIWTLQDAQTRRADLLGAVNAAFGDVIGTLRAGVRLEK